LDRTDVFSSRRRFFSAPLPFKLLLSLPSELLFNIPYQRGWPHYITIKETLIKDMSPDSPMDFSSGTGKKRRDTSSIARLFAEVRRKISGSYGGHE
jgi:hypothetical protein